MEHSMSLAVGGRIRQTIIRDTSKKEDWDSDSTVVFNVQIVNSELFKQVTGSSPPPTLVTASQYAANGQPYFAIYDEKPTGIFGTFPSLKSVATLDEAKGTKGSKKAAAEVKTSTINPLIWLRRDGRRHHSPPDPNVQLNPSGPRLPFRHLSDLQAVVRTWASSYRNT